MGQSPEVPRGPLEAGREGAASGDVPIADGDRVYVVEEDLIAGKYRVERILGVGGVGFVVAARHMELGGDFALKFLKKRVLADKVIVERFIREARAACRIKSEHVARVYDVGSHDGAPFLVMEHLVGRDLAAVLAEHGPLAIPDAVDCAVQACAALAAAHANGVVHRDIKPDNLFVVDEDGLETIKLLDFGISKIALAAERPEGEWGAEGEPITGTLTCGTPFYMSPEQVRSTATVDSRSDVWSLGMVLYELLSGSTAFAADAVADVCKAILEREPCWLRDLRPDVPPTLADVVARCLQKDPADRFQGAADLAVALLPFASPRALSIAESSAWIRRAAFQSLGNMSDGRASGGFAIAIDAGPSGRFRTGAITPPPARPSMPDPVSSPGAARSEGVAPSPPPAASTGPSLRPRKKEARLHASSALAGACAVLIAGAAAWGTSRLLDVRMLRAFGARAAHGAETAMPPPANPVAPAPAAERVAPAGSSPVLSELASAAAVKPAALAGAAAAASPAVPPTAAPAMPSAASATRPGAVTAGPLVPASSARAPFSGRGKSATGRGQSASKSVAGATATPAESTTPPPAAAPAGPARSDLGY